MLALKKNISKNVVSTFMNLIIHPYLAKIQHFKPNIPLTIEKGDFIIKTAENPEELELALRLRHKVFYEELLKRQKKAALDIDRFDFICDHLMIIDKKTNNCIGTYRFNSSLFSDSFYSETEFHMSSIKAIPGNKLELGRACIDKEHRNGLTISLLWSGISAYLKASDSQYLFGCSSIKTVDFHQIACVYKFLKDKYLADENTRVRPRKKFAVKRLEDYTDFLGKVELSYKPGQARKMVPSLLKSYLKAGAMICGEPALDKDFQCIDFFTLMNVDDITNSVMNKFSV